MRFAQVINPKKYPGGVLTIPDAEFAAMIEAWIKTMASWRYRRETRTEHWQEAIDVVYTALEAALRTTDARQLMAHRKWQIMMLAAKTWFPEHIAVYHPTPVEQQRIGRLVRISRLRRVLKDKMELMRILKQDHALKVRTITELTVSRLQCEMLSASAYVLVSRFSNISSPSAATASASAERSAGASAGVVGVGIKASASASAVASAQAGYDSGRKAVGLGFQHRVQAAVEATASAESSAVAGAYADKLLVSGNAGLGAETRAEARFDYEIERTCKVKTEYLRRLLGDKFRLVQGHLQGRTSVRAGVSGEASASSSLGGKVNWDITAAEDPVSGSFNVGSASAEGEVELAVKMSGSAGVTLMQSLDVEVSGDLLAHATASGELKCFLNGRGLGLDIGAQALAGFEVGSSQTLSIKHPSRHLSILSLQLRESFTAGAGIEGSLKGRLTYDQIAFKTSSSVTLGVGSGVGLDTVISSRGALLAGYDLIIAPAIMGLGAAMRRHDPMMSSSHTRRMQNIVDFLNRQASKGEIGQVYLDNQTRIATLIAGLDAEADRLLDAKRKLRSAGFKGYTSMTLQQAGATSLESAYLARQAQPRATPLQRVFGSEADGGQFFLDPNDPGKTIAGPQGDRGRVITQKGLQTGMTEVQTAAVAGARRTLHQVASDYERARLQGSGECLGFDVIRADMVRGTLPYI